MCVMQHELDVDFPGGRSETRVGQLLVLGDPVPRGHSAMARTVGLTAAAGARPALGRGVRRRASRGAEGPSGRERGAGWALAEPDRGAWRAAGVALVLGRGRGRLRGGVLGPTTRDVYEPVLAALAADGVECREASRARSGSGGHGAWTSALAA
jgi:hypothetical protein